MNYTILIIIIGLLIGVSAVAVNLLRMNARLHADNTNLQTRNDEMRAQIDREMGANASLTQRLAEETAQKRVLTERLQSLSDDHAQQRHDQALAFKQMATEILQNQTNQFREHNERRLTELLEPLRENLHRFSTSITGYGQKQAENTATLQQQIKDLAEMNRSLGREAKELAQALRGNSKVQGDWGEMILTRILESAGLKRGLNYDLQVTQIAGEVLKDDQGKQLRPDAVFFLPDNKCLVLDAKTSLTAYTSMVASSDTDEQQQFLQEHCQSVRRHIDELARRNYTRYIASATDFVVMFIPNEGAYLSALQADDSLWQYAYERKVVIVSPTHLISVVKLISELWSADSRNKNALRIAEETGRLYAKLNTFLGYFTEIEKNLDKAKVAYDRALNNLSTGRGNVIKKAHQISQLGIKAGNNSLLEKTFQNSDNDDIDEGTDSSDGV